VVAAPKHEGLGTALAMVNSIVATASLVAAWLGSLVYHGT
jgi:hypothetical protein